MKSSDSHNQALTCSVPPPLSDDDLFAFLDGEAEASVQSHVDQCAYCSSRLEDIRVLEHTVKGAMYRADCPPAERLADYIMGLPMASDKARIDDHLAHCLHCRREIEQLRATFVIEEQLVQESENEPVWERIKGFLQVIDEHLVRILLPASPKPYGQPKGFVTSDSRIYGDDTISVQIWVEKMADQVKIIGNIIDLAGVERWIDGSAEFVSVDNGQTLKVVIIDEIEMFTVDSILPGKFNLNLYSPHGHVLRLQEVQIEV